jgi:hypothetical protein
VIPSAFWLSTYPNASKSDGDRCRIFSNPTDNRDRVPKGRSTEPWARQNRLGKPRSQNTERLSPSVIAIDGPLLPEGTAHDIRRHVDPFSFAPHSTIVADPDLVIMEWDWN